MVGGSDFEQRPFNLATQGRRQPGSAFKPFTLVAALEKGISPGPHVRLGAEDARPARAATFKVENYEDRYSGVTSLATATTVSDNSVYAEVGYKLVGTQRGRARRAGDGRSARTLSTQPGDGARRPASVGVTPLEMAKSYETLAHEGERRVGIARRLRRRARSTFTQGRGRRHRRQEQGRSASASVPEGVAKQATQILSDRGHARHRPRRPDRRVRGRQDRHHRELPGRLVRRASTTT